MVIRIMKVNEIIIRVGQVWRKYSRSFFNGAFFYSFVVRSCGQDMRVEDFIMREKWVG